jgi:hypothetical protein
MLGRIHATEQSTDQRQAEYELKPRDQYEVDLDSITSSAVPTDDPVREDAGVKTLDAKVLHFCCELLGVDGTKETQVRFWGLNKDIRVHQVVDRPGPPLSADATDLNSAIALLNELKVLFNAHLGSAEAHLAADSTNTVTSPDATDQGTAETLANEIKADHNAHRVGTTYHARKDGETAVAAADASDLTTLKALANELKEDLGNHFGYGGKWFQLGQYGSAETYHRANSAERLDLEGRGWDAVATQFVTMDSGLEGSTYIMPG